MNQEPPQIQSCEPPTALNVLLWPVALPKNRVGGSAAFSFVFAFQFIGETLDTPAGNGGCGYDFASGVHKYLYAADNPVDNTDPSGHDYGDFNISLASIFGFISLIGSSVTSEPGFENLALSPSITVDFDVDTSGIPPSFHASDVQNTLQKQLSDLVFNNPPAGHSVTIKVSEQATAPGKLGWIGTPKNDYVNWVTWDLSGDVVSSRDFKGLIQVNTEKIGEDDAKYSRNAGTQTWVNIFAHEGIYGNAGDHWDRWFGTDGEISARIAFLYDPFTVSTDSRTTIRNDFGF